MRNIAERARLWLVPDRFAVNVAVVSLGTATGQLVAIAAAPVLTRVYAPAEYGALGVYIAITASFMSAVWVCMGAVKPAGNLMNAEKAPVAWFPQTSAIITPGPVFGSSFPM